MNNFDSPRLGRRLKAVRLSKKLSLKQVSERSGLSIPTLSKVENGKISLTYDRIAALSNALGVDMRLFFDTNPVALDIAGEPVVTARRSIHRKGHDLEVHSANNDYIVLFKDVLRKRFFPMIMRIKARSIEEYGPLTRHSGEEMALVLKGRVEFHTEHYASVLLEEGDSVFVDSSMRHGYTNAGDGEALILAVTSDDFEEILAAREDARS